ncbi:NADP-dependent oxidoreductase [Streptosporangium sp. NPDC000396]|uniref:NADP-dependent oxidoreductase n=1 Tax=Streptosporangium sp. NPDC000396 TaxID=3366185 RepID=UPI0036D0B63C
MRAITQSAFGDPSVLKVVDVDRPEPSYGQVLIKVGAAGVNPVDGAVRSGAYPLLGEPPYTIGWDVAGVVELAGPGVSAFAPGDEVLGLLAFPGAGNAYADYVLASPNEIIHKPTGLTMEEAGALPLAGLTAWQALVGLARVSAGQRVLIHAAAGGVGHLAVQIAKAGGAHVIGTARAEKHDFLRGLGADTLIDHTTADFVAEAGPVDVVLDLVGGEYGPRSAAVLKPGGVLVGAVGSNLGITPEAAAEQGVRLAVQNVRPSAADLAQLATLVETGRLKVHVGQVLPLAEAAKAHELISARHTTGKIVLVP